MGSHIVNSRRYCSPDDFVDLDLPQIIRQNAGAAILAEHDVSKREWAEQRASYHSFIDTERAEKELARHHIDMKQARKISRHLKGILEYDTNSALREIPLSEFLKKLCVSPSTTELIARVVSQQYPLDPKATWTEFKADILCSIPKFRFQLLFKQDLSKFYELNQIFQFIGREGVSPLSKQDKAILSECNHREEDVELHASSRAPYFWETLREPVLVDSLTPVTGMTLRELLRNLRISVETSRLIVRAIVGESPPNPDLFWPPYDIYADELTNVRTLRFQLLFGKEGKNWEELNLVLKEAGLDEISPLTLREKLACFEKSDDYTRKAKLTNPSWSHHWWGMLKRFNRNRTAPRQSPERRNVVGEIPQQSPVSDVALLDGRNRDMNR